MGDPADTPYLPLRGKRVGIPKDTPPPASTSYHGSYTGGLLDHSLNVYDHLKRLMSAYPEIEIDQESAVIAALFHDLTKVNFYTTEKRNLKNEQGQWETYNKYTIKEKFCYGDHGSKSVFIVQSFLRLKPEEAVAINCHMGCWDGNKDVADSCRYTYTKGKSILAKTTVYMEKYDLSLIPSIVPGTTKVSPYSYKNTKTTAKGEIYEENVNEVLVSADTTWTWVNNSNPEERITVS